MMIFAASAQNVTNYPATDEKTSEVASNMTYLELSTHPGYMDAFVAACFIPHTDRSLFPSCIQA